MSLVKKNERISVKQFAAVPPLLDLPAIQRGPASVSDVSCSRGPGDGAHVDLAEGCIVTKSVRYTNQLTHIINRVRCGDLSDVVSERAMGHCYTR